jgi:peptidoglycan/xylan/chitin deacetylase (PgdA/CDA1 family)
MKIADRITGRVVSLVSHFTPRFLNNRRFTILIYHRVLDSRDPLLMEEPDRDLFDWQMELISKYFRPMSLSAALDASKQGVLEPGVVCVTFDDGYADNERNALPILKKWGVPATFFVSTGFMDGTSMWNDIVIETIRRLNSDVVDLTPYGLGIESVKTLEQKRTVLGKLLKKIKYLPPEERTRQVEAISHLSGDRTLNLMMSDEKVKALFDAGMEIGAHTVTHPILMNLSDEEAMQEIVGSVDRLQEITGKRPTLFAYPNGKPGTDYTSRDSRLVEKIGLKAAVSTHWGAVDVSTNAFELPRFTPWDKTPSRFALRILMNNFGKSFI